MLGQLSSLLDGLKRDISELEDLAKREISVTNREMAKRYYIQAKAKKI
jgi:hypothetical protein